MSHRKGTIVDCDRVEIYLRTGARKGPHKAGGPCNGPLTFIIGSARVCIGIRCGFSAPVVSLQSGRHHCILLQRCERRHCASLLRWAGISTVSHRPNALGCSLSPAFCYFCFSVDVATAQRLYKVGWRRHRLVQTNCACLLSVACSLQFLFRTRQRSPLLLNIVNALH